MNMVFIFIMSCILPQAPPGRSGKKKVASMLRSHTSLNVFTARRSWVPAAFSFLLLLMAPAMAQQAPAAQVAQDEVAAPSAADATEAVTIFPHSQTARWWVSGQSNTIFQAHPSFHAKYSGTNSLESRSENDTSRVETLYTGFLLTKSTEALFDLESAGGRGLSNALGLAGFTDLDVVRNPSLGEKPYVARVELHQTIRLSQQDVAVDRGPLSLATSAPARRLELRFGKLSTVDFFDANSIGSDSHNQFLNWTADNNGAYDYAADTRGYTYGFEAEYQSVRWAFRFGEMLMPKVANGIDLDWNVSRARAENYELELRPTLMKARKTVLRLLVFENHANMGTYRQAVARWKAGIDPTPNIVNTRRQGTVKYGFGVNAEQELGRGVRVFARWSWNEGQHESFAYTEVDSAVSGGADVSGAQWHRKLDRVGMAMMSNAISADHQAYLRDGGLGFLLGDGGLNYGRENILEGYYNLHAWRGVFLGVDVQRIWNPGYNRDRGPVIVPGLRLHVEL